MAKQINFYSTKDPFGEFSNFAQYPINIGGIEYQTTEHFFQAMKFATHPPSMKVVMEAATPMEAAKLGRDRSKPLRRDWEEAKHGIMMDALRAKFTQHPELKRLLLSTGDDHLVEHTKNDNYWGDGGDGSGQNMLGRMLVQLRHELRQAQLPFVVVSKMAVAGL